jgi:hypothetical protein
MLACRDGAGGNHFSIPSMDTLTNVLVAVGVLEYFCTNA